MSDDLITDCSTQCNGVNDHYLYGPHVTNCFLYHVSLRRERERERERERGRERERERERERGREGEREREREQIIECMFVL